jgi:hypothetical protein
MIQRLRSATILELCRLMQFALALVVGMCIVRAPNQTGL